MIDNLYQKIAGGSWSEAMATAMASWDGTSPSDPKLLNTLACLMIRDRRMARARALFQEAARLGNREAADNLRSLGWEEMEDNKIQEGRVFPPDTNVCSPELLVRSDRYLASVTELLLPVISERLDAVHCSAFGTEFWRRALGMGLDRHLVLAYDHFLMAEAALANNEVAAVTLDRKCFHVPADYDDLHWFLSDREFGQEQLFSLYCSHFHPERFPSRERHYRSDYALNRDTTPPTPHQPVVGILGSWFKDLWLDRLILESGNDIQCIGFDRTYHSAPTLEREKREFLSRPEAGCDRFCNFFLSTLSSLMPRIFIEDWQQVYRFLSIQMSLYRRLKYVVSELWIGDAMEPIVLAILMRQGVRTVYHEHNYSEHPYVASAVRRWSRLCDIYLAHGSHGALIPNGVVGGSLFDFGEEQSSSRDRTCDILYVSSLAFTRDSLFSGSSALAGNGSHAERCVEFKRAFLSRLPREILARIHYRGYPRDGYGRNWKTCRDDMVFLEEFFSEATRDDLSRNCKETMARSRLVLVSYLATTHLESLHMNIPTVILFAASIEYVDPRFRDFFAPLMDTGICQTNPKRAAEFVAQICDDPETWWQSPDVQTARKEFLAAALGDPGTSIRFMLGLARQ